MEDDIMISIASFSKYPSGRDDHDGSFNGEKFRTTVLVPAITQAQSTGGKVLVSLKGVMSFGSSFLEEAFGGLVRREGFSFEELERILKIDPGKPHFSRHERSIWTHIQRAKQQ